MFENGLAEMNFAQFFIGTPKGELTGGVVVEGPSNSGWHVGKCLYSVLQKWMEGRPKQVAPCQS
jgi:hypothetical protein